MQIAKIEITGRHIAIALIKDMTEKELTGGHITIMFYIKMEKKFPAAIVDLSILC